MKMLKQIRETSPCFKARIAGAFYLLSVMSAIIAETFIHGKLLYVVSLIPVLCFAIVTLLIYDIFKTVSRNIAFLALFFNFASLTWEALELHLRGVNGALLFHGIYCVLAGWLVFRSSLLPRILGVLMSFAGLAWLLTSLSPLLTHIWHTRGQTLGFLGEGMLMLWLLIPGVTSRQQLSGTPNRTQ